MAPENGFSEYKKLFLSEFSEIKKNVAELQKGQVKMIIAIETLKIRASIWGATAGALPLLALYLVKEFGN